MTEQEIKKKYAEKTTITKAEDGTDIYTCSVHGTFVPQTIEAIGICFNNCQKCAYDMEAEILKLKNAKVKEDRLKAIEYEVDKACVPLRYRESTVNNFKASTDEMKDIKKTCIEYVTGFDKIQQSGAALFMVGNNGTGKTHLGCGMLMGLIRQNKIKAGIYIPVLKMIRDIRSSYQPNVKKTEQQIIDYYAGIDLLVLDEVGVQYGTDGEKSLLFDVLNDRYNNFKPTILITNCDKKDLSNFLGKSVVDRLLSKNGIMLEFGWDSHRRN